MRFKAAKTISEILSNATDTLVTAQLGLEAMRSEGPRDRWYAGLRNVVVFGRSVTFVLQNLRSIEPKFEAWYQPYVLKMSSDELMSFLKELRNEVPGGPLRWAVRPTQKSSLPRCRCWNPPTIASPRCKT